jgi:acetylglutamate kinase
LVAALGLAGARAVGISGEDGGLLRALPLGDGSLGAVGEVRDVNTSLISLLVGGGYLPVVAPVATPLSSAASATGPGAFNVNGDDAAAAIAGALGVKELMLISDVPGVRLGGHFVSQLSRAEAERGIADGEIAGGMEAKVQAALASLERGVTRVRIGGPAILSDVEAGTTISVRAGSRSVSLQPAECRAHEVGV